MKRITTWRAWAATVAGVAAVALVPGATAAAAPPQLLLVHGYGEHEQGKDCNGSTWKNALAYYTGAGGRDRSSISTIGYYSGDDRASQHGAAHGCDAIVGDGAATNDRPIQDIARDLAQHVHRDYTSQGRPVDLVGHSMGGLITRVALLGSAQGWEGFPPRLDVDDVVTLGTPHQGVRSPGAGSDRQWSQMTPRSGFIARLHADGSGLGDGWAAGTDWSLVGSEEDGTVSDESAIDKGEHADQKFRYLDDPRDSGEVDHGGIRTLFGENAYRLSYWHAAGDHPAHETERGWSPLKAAFQAATKEGDGVPR